MDLPSASIRATRIGALAVSDTGPPGAGGETIVLWPSILTDHRIYRRQIDAWRSRHRLVLIDGPGHGRSGPAPMAFSMRDCGYAVSEVLEQLAITEPIVMVGTSWGGLVAGEFALEFPLKTRAIVMLNTPVFTALHGPSFGDRFVVWGARWIHRSRMYRDGVARAFFLPNTRLRHDDIQRDFDQHLREIDGVALAHAVHAVLLERQALAPRMDRIDAPTLVVAGRYDAMYPLESLRSAAARLPKGHFEVLDTAHISVVDQPENVTELIDTFLAKHVESA